MHGAVECQGAAGALTVVVGETGDASSESGGVSGPSYGPTEAVSPVDRYESCVTLARGMALLRSAVGSRIR